MAKKILLAWEYGGGFGHVAMLVPLALKLRHLGYEPVLALRDIRTSSSLWKDTGLTVIQAPFIRLPTTWDKTIRTDTLADVFQLGGLIDKGKLTALAHAWQKLLAAIQPDLVICEFSPTLALVTLGVIPTITVGTGFSLPPAGRPLPSIRFWDETLSERSIQHEQALYQAISTTRHALGLPPIAFFADLFGGEQSFICTLPELDCYAKYRTNSPIGPLTSVTLPILGQSILPTNASWQAFAYLAGEEENLQAILGAIQQSTIRCDAYIRTLDPEKLPPNHTIHLHNTPQPLNDLLPERALLIHHGGMSTADIALRLGVPQLVLSRHLEQKCTGGLLMQAGVGELLMAHHPQDLDRMQDVLKQIVSNPMYRHNAHKKALEIAARPSRPAVDIVAEACEKLIGKNVIA